ncbi:hypothetical protein KBC75_06045 [Candidatus Shapirobacteria bacterium]|nr:hypothetical protein [Candidatus Shapirobacteria bacterium]
MKFDLASDEVFFRFSVPVYPDAVWEDEGFRRLKPTGGDPVNSEYELRKIQAGTRVGAVKDISPNFVALRLYGKEVPSLLVGKVVLVRNGMIPNKTMEEIRKRL